MSGCQDGHVPKAEAGSDLDRELAKRARRFVQRFAVPFEAALYVLPALSSLGFALLAFGPGWLWLGIPPLLLHLVLLLSQSWWRNVLNNVEASKRALLDDTIAPIARTAAGMHALSSARQREEAFKRISRQAIDAVLLTIDAHGLRAVVYSLEAGADSFYVVDQNSRGRRDDAGAFAVGGDKTAVALQALRENRARFVEDCSSTPPPEGGENLGYETYISVPIGSDSVAYGILTVDSPRAGDLTKQHVNDLELVASVLAMAFAELSGDAPRRTTPRVGN